MTALWAHSEPISARAVLRAIGDPDLAYTTVMTTLQRLARKGLVRQDTEVRAHRFSAIATRDELFAELMSEALGIAGDDHRVLVRFIDQMEPQAREVLTEALGESDRETDS